MRATTVESKRPTRAKVTGKRNVLNVTGKDPDFHYRIVNDTGDRVEMFKEQGYEVVTDNKVKIGERRIANPTQEGSVVSASVGGGTRGVLMRIRKDWHQEDQAAKSAQVDETEMSMKRLAKEGMYGKLEINKD